MDHVRPSSRYSYPSVAAVAVVLALARHWLPWELEAPVRHRIRYLLVLQGCSWGRADWIGHSLVARGRIVNGVRQPAGYDSDYDLSSWTGSADCAICDRRFIPRRSGQETCSEACRRRKRYLDTCPVHLRRCEHCRDPMAVSQPSQKYCSTRCQKAASYLRTKKEWGRVRHCRTCGGPIPDSLRGDGAYCSVVCRNKWHREQPGAVDARREAYRQAAGLVVRSNCTQCGKPLPDGSNARRKYCSAACNTANFRARKLNRHANGHDHHATNEHAADLRPDPATVQQAVALIQLQLLAIQNECPEMTPRQQLAEARRRCAAAMVAAADAVEAKRYGLRLR